MTETTGDCDEDAVTQVGKHVTWTMEKRGKHTEVVGTIDREETVPGMVITTDEGKFPAIRFRIKPDDGSRAVWTCAFADTRHIGSYRRGES